jgi:hypothetical protein
MSTDPFQSGTFYTGQFVTEQARFQFLNPLRDQRQCIMMEIEPIVQTSLLAFAQASHASTNAQFFSYYFVDENGDLQSLSRNNATIGIPISPFPPSIDLSQQPPLVIEGIRWVILGGAPPPKVLVFVDETGDYVYLQSTYLPQALSLVSSSTPAVPERPHTTRFVGRYVELLALDGHSIYRLSIDSALTIHLDFDRDEPWRTQSICLQNGHPYLYHRSRTWIPSLIRLGDVTTQVSVTDAGYGGVAVPRLGVVEVSMHNEFFDFLTLQDWDSRDFTLWVGSTDERPELYPVLLRGKTEAASWDEDTIRIDIADAGLLLDRVIQNNTYAGTGGLEGDEELEGKLKPILLGSVPLLEPVLINPNWIYQFHDGPAHAQGIVSQGGVILHGFLGDFPGELESWEPTQAEVDNGSYRTDLGAGMFRLAAPPGGRVTLFSPIGSTDLPLVSRIADIVLWAANRVIPETPIATASINAFRTFYLQTVGIYITEEKSLQRLYDELMLPIQAVTGIDRVGNLFMRTLLRQDPVAHIMEEDILEGSFSRTPPPKPGATHKIGFRRSYVQLSESDLLGAADPTLRSLGLEEFRYRTSGPYPALIADRFPSATARVIPTHVIGPSEADSLAWQIIYREQAYRDVFTFTVKDHSWLLSIGDNILLQHSRFGLDVPRQCVIVGITERSPTTGSDDQSGENTTSLICLG